jgi:tRNA1Val (adenine37-N6)-methyltransferase
MGNSFFRFKQFTVYQELCAMKVCTDACLFGALAPVTDAAGHTIQQVLDIGAGTGLLSLMYAQKNTTAAIEAVEIDEAAAEQARGNFRQSPWAARLALFHQPVQAFTPAHGYDLILSNPPFYAGSLKSDNTRRNLALHSDALQLDELFSLAAQHLAPNGWLYLLLPYQRAAESITLAANRGLHLHSHIQVKQTPAHAYFRSLLQWGRLPATAVTSELVIMNEHQQYTPAFKAALQPYYLYL